MAQVLPGIRVLDLGSFITAPYAAMLLAEMGADVVKVEKPVTGDPFRAFGSGLYSSHFQAHNRNKRSLALDYTKASGAAALDKLVADADVVLVNVRPGVQEKLGVGYERLNALNPRLVYCAITGYGATGPYADRPAYDNVGQALSGWLSMFHEGTDARVAGPAVSDALTGLYAAMGILGALVERGNTGKGRKVEVSMLEATIAFATEPLGKLFANGIPVPHYSRAASSQSFIVTCGDGNRIGLHLSSPEKFWRGLLKAISQEELAQKYPDRASRVQRYDELAVDLAAVFATKPRDYWLPLLEQNDVPFAPERRLEELREDPQVKHLDVFYDMTHPQYGKVSAAHRPVRYDGDNHSNFLPPPALGEHTREVLAQAGLSPSDIKKLADEGVI
ncbi:MAG: CoA transferase [Polaromonas sp.]|uniref:CaiB/BaiF CoA transferase family protein n=1 Tax=Polaromonas sp. TaxID=1869339 RepID=UPI0025FB58B9|nr:CoA transferase [Polaromonas sp.]MBI2728951.1 CoA transferase [Polaromonas sp.]